jgi:hypothetical protein
MSIGNYTRLLHHDADDDPLNQRINASLSGTLDELPDTFENWNKDDVREAIEGLQRADERKATVNANADSWAINHPEYLDTAKNGAVFNRALNAMFGPITFTVEHFEKCYQVLRANNTLELDEGEIVKQHQAAANARAKAERARRAAETRVFSEEEKYSMSLEELRRVEDREIQKRAQRIGEEGGW